MEQHTEQSNNVTVRSYSGYLKPISPAQIAALGVVADGEVFYKQRWGRVFGIRNDVFVVLERNELVEVLAEAENPEARESDQRHPVVLTDTGRSALDRCRS